jgi:hypothetical protein
VSILDSLLSAGDGSVVKQLTSQFGINADQAGSVVSTLLPALAGGLKEKLASGQGSSITDLISGGTLSKYADNPASLTGPAAVEQGKSLLSGIFGGGDLTNMVSMVAEKVGISSSVVTTMLPIVATLFGSFLSKSTADGKTSLTDVVGQLADAGQGGIFAAVKSFAAKLMG